MEKFIEKFNIFDIFTMLGPGLIISCLYGVSLSFQYYDIWKNYGNEKYVIFFVFSYFLGIIFQEIGTVLDKKCIWKCLYGGEPRQIFLSENLSENIFANQLECKNALRVKKYIKEYIDPELYRNASQKERNSIIFEYCLNICELNGLTFKADKMLVISEMSRSIFWGCLSTIMINLYLISIGSYGSSFLYYEILLLLFVAAVFLWRKKRYEQYRIRILIRVFLIYMEQQRGEEINTVGQN